MNSIPQLSKVVLAKARAKGYDLPDNSHYAVQEWLFIEHHIFVYVTPTKSFFGGFEWRYTINDYGRPYDVPSGMVYFDIQKPLLIGLSKLIDHI